MFNYFFLWCHINFHCVAGRVGMMMRGSGQMQAHNLQMQNHMLQQVVSGQLLGQGQGTTKSFLTKLGLQPDQTAIRTNASMQKVCFTFRVFNSFLSSLLFCSHFNLTLSTFSPVLLQLFQSCWTVNQF